MISSALLAALPGIRHAHTERSDGAVGGRDVAGVPEARARLAAALGCEAASIALPAQVHGNRVVSVSAADRGAVVPSADGLVTSEVGIALLVQGADCPLLALADAEAGVVAVVHSGWRGTASRIAEHAVRSAVALGARPERVHAAVFPGIGVCCFEVGPDVVGSFREAFGADAEAWFRPGRGDRRFLDLGAAITSTLTRAGVLESSVDLVPGCTACDERFFSHRASRGGPERHGLAIARVS